MYLVNLMRHILTTVLLLFVSCYTFSQEQSADTSKKTSIVLQEAEKMADLLLKKDYTAFSKYIHPALAKMMGGKGNMVAEMKKALDEMESQGFVLNKIDITELSGPFTIKTEIQYTLKQVLTIKTNNGRLMTEAALIAISPDSGKNWYYMDTNGKDLKEMQKLLPSLSNKLIIPEPQKPVFHKD